MHHDHPRQRHHRSWLEICCLGCTVPLSRRSPYLYEFGYVAPEGIAYVPDLAKIVNDERSDLPELARDICRKILAHIGELTDHLADVGAKITAVSKISTMPRRLHTVPGIGPITALAIETFAPPMQVFRRARDFAAWVGSVPRQHSSGGKQRLGKTSKNGQRDIRLSIAMEPKAVTQHRSFALGEVFPGFPVGGTNQRLDPVEALAGGVQDRNPPHPTVDRMRREQIECGENPRAFNRLTLPRPYRLAPKQAYEVGPGQSEIESPYALPVKVRCPVVCPVLLLDRQKVCPARSTTARIVEIGALAPGINRHNAVERRHDPGFNGVYVKYHERALETSSNQINSVPSGRFVLPDHLPPDRNGEHPPHANLDDVASGRLAITLPYVDQGILASWQAGQPHWLSCPEKIAPT